MGPRPTLDHRYIKYDKVISGIGARTDKENVRALLSLVRVLEISLEAYRSAVKECDLEIKDLKHKVYLKEYLLRVARKKYSHVRG